jgi:lipid-A-disaccharide synthase
MKYYIIAGEASGDLHGANLIKELIKMDQQAEIRCWGGDLMQEAGATVVKHYKELAFMGFTEVIKNLPAIVGNFRFCKLDILSYQPDALILIDYPGFNLRMTKWAKEHEFKVIYYISPQVWAWKESRVKIIKRYVDKMLVILPFEKEFYKKWNFEVEYVGHPLVEVIDEFRMTSSEHGFKKNKQEVPDGISVAQKKGIPVVALLPGSRKQEILKKLPVMLAVSKLLPQYRFIVAQAPGQDETFYQELLKDYPDVATVRDGTYELLSSASAACVTSGTATLETALFGVPEVVCYKSNFISYQIAKHLIKVKYISLVNLIMDKPLVRELIQDDLTPDHLYLALKDLLNNPQKRQQLEIDYKNLRNILGKQGNASANAAKSIINYLHI